MEQVTEQVKKGPKKVANKKQMHMKNLTAESVKILKQLSEKANKKNYGRRVMDGEIIEMALGLVQSDHLRQLQENTYSERDRLSIVHEEFQKENGKITLDDFIGRLIRGEVRPLAQKNLNAAQSK